MREDREHQELDCVALQSVLRSQPHLGLSNEQLSHLAACDACAEVWIVRWLGSVPDPEIPAEFATNLCARLPVLPARPERSQRRYSGYTVSLAVLVVLACVFSIVFAAAPQYWLPRGIPGAVVALILITEIVTLAIWLGARRPT